MTTLSTPGNTGQQRKCQKNEFDRLHVQHLICLGIEESLSTSAERNVTLQWYKCSA